MNTIWKFPFQVTDDFEIEMPVGAQFLHVDVQNDYSPCLWAIVDPKAPKEVRKFHLSGTGHPLNKKLTKANHVGSFFLRGGQLVFHLFWE